MEGDPDVEAALLPVEGPNTIHHPLAGHGHGKSVSFQIGDESPPCEERLNYDYNRPLLDELERGEEQDMLGELSKPVSISVPTFFLQEDDDGHEGDNAEPKPSEGDSEGVHLKPHRNGHRHHHHHHHRHHHRDGTRHHHHHHHRDNHEDCGRQHKHHHRHHHHHDNGSTRHIPKNNSKTDLFTLIMAAKEAHIDLTEIEQEIRPEPPSQEAWYTCRQCLHVIRPRSLHPETERLMQNDARIFWCRCEFPDPIPYESYAARLTHCESFVGLRSAVSAASGVGSTASSLAYINSTQNLLTRGDSFASSRTTLMQVATVGGALYSMDTTANDVDVELGQSAAERQPFLKPGGPTQAASATSLRRVESDSCLAPYESKVDKRQHLTRVESKARHLDAAAAATANTLGKDSVNLEVAGENSSAAGARGSVGSRILALPAKFMGVKRRSKIKIIVFSTIAVLILAAVIIVPIYARTARGPKNNQEVLSRNLPTGPPPPS